MTYPSVFNTIGSGIAEAFAAEGATKNILIIGDQNMHLSGGTMQAFRRLTTNLCGFFLPGILNSGVDEPATAVTDVTTNLTVGSTLWPFRGDIQPNVPGANEGFILDTSAAAGDGTTEGVPSDIIPAGFQEIIWPQSASAPGADQRFAKWTLASVTGNDAWLTDHQLTITPFMYVPAADATGTNPIDGGPTLSMGVSRGVAAPTVAAAFTAAATGAIVAGTPATLAAGAGMPVVGLYWPTSAANSKRRAIIPGVMVVNNQTEGVRLLCFANPYATIASYDPAGSVDQYKAEAFANISTAVGGIDAIMVMLGSELDAAFLNASLYGDMRSELASTEPAIDEYPLVGSWSEVAVDVANALRDWGGVAAVVDRPIVFVLPCFAGQADSLADWDIVHENLLKQTHFMCTNTETPSPPPAAALHKWTEIHLAYVDLGNWWSPTEIMTGGLITKGGTTIRGTWNADDEYVSGDIVASPNAGFAGGSGAHNWYVSKTTNTAVEPGITADWADDWDKLDFRPTEAFAQAQVARVLYLVTAGYAGANAGSQEGNDLRSPLIDRSDRTDRV